MLIVFVDPENIGKDTIFMLLDFNLNFRQLLDNLIEEDMIQEVENSTLYFQSHKANN